MKKTLILLFALTFASVAFAQNAPTTTEVSGGPWWSKTRVTKYKVVNDDVDSGDRWGLLIIIWLIALVVIWIDIGAVIL
jgi:hypothetical protein